MAESSQQSVQRQNENENKHQSQKVEFRDDCPHKIRDSGFNERRELGLALDNHGNGQGILALMRNLLEQEDVLNLWRSSRSGLDPALGFLCYLSHTNLTTLEDLEGYVQSVGDNAFPELLKIIRQAKENDSQLANKPLQELPFELLQRMAGEMTARPDPHFQPMQKTWKNIAGNVPNFDQETINNLAATNPLDQDQTLTEILLNYVSTSNPDSTLVWLAKGLRDIQRIDLLYKDIFKGCRSNRAMSVDLQEVRCIKFLGDSPDGGQEPNSSDSDPIDLR